MVQGISLLLDRQGKDGLLVRGSRLKSDRVINWLGSSSFDSETIDPWAQIMEQNSEIANAITHAWTEISSAYNQTHVEMDQVVDTGDMLNNPAKRAGFAADGKITKRSTTQIITSKLETAKFKLLKYSVEHKTKDGSSFKPTNRERLVFNNTDTYSAQFVAALPCLLGIMHDRVLHDRVLHEAFAQYLALPSPAMVPFVTHYCPIGSEEQEKNSSLTNMVIRSHVQRSMEGIGLDHMNN